MREIIEKLRSHKPSLIGLDEVYHGSVCIPLIDNSILFEIRSEKIKGQPGDVCLPGGKIENEETPKEAAIRECCEELLIKKEQIEIIGAADIFHRETTIIYPFVAQISGYDNTFSKDEVAGVFTVPVDFFLENEPERYSVDSKVIPGEDFPYDRIVGGRSYRWRSRAFDELFYEYNGITIWGLTARIIYSFANIIR